MAVFEFIAIIVAFVILGDIVKKYIDKKHTSAHEEMDSLREQLQELSHLKQRVETLEAIVTDKGYNLKEEIDNLK